MANLSVMRLATGARFGTYEIVGPIGSGGMGEVYRARHTRLKRDVAVKVLPSVWVDVPTVWSAFNVRRSCWRR